MNGANVNLKRHRVINAPAGEVWEWMCDPSSLDLFRVNVFHVDAEFDGEELQVGSQVRVEHNLGIRREMRIARISTLRPFEIAWGEIKAEGKDWFPHYQKLVLTARGEGSCEIHNTLRGTFNLPGAKWWLLSWYRYFLPLVLDSENRKIASATERPRRDHDTSH